VIDTLFSGKIRAKLLSRLLVNPNTMVHLRQLSRELNVSSNTVRIELNKLKEASIISEVDTNNGSIKKYTADTSHPLFEELRSILLKYLGIDQLLEVIFEKIGNLEKVFITGDLAQGKPAVIIDLVLVGDIDRDYFNSLVFKAEELLKKKIRAAIYSSLEFKMEVLDGVHHLLVFDIED
jgi:hypothetical protein